MDSRKCNACHEEKPLTAFKKTYNTCRPCKRKAITPEQLNKERAKCKKNREKLAEYIRAKKSQPCMDCGNEYPFYVMDYDHRPGEQKLFNIAMGYFHAKALHKIEAEIAKCDLVCANCHRRRTYNRRYGGKRKTPA